MSNELHSGRISLTAMIISAYVSKNAVRPADLPALIDTVSASLGSLTGAIAKPVVEDKKEPAISIKKSVTPDYIICLEDGKQFKSLKRHLRTAYDLTPEQYRSKWNLPHDYPMVAPAYAAARSALAKESGLGQQRPGLALKKMGQAMATVSNPPKRGRGRPKASKAA